MDLMFVTDAAHGQQVTRLVGVGLQLAAEVLDIRADCGLGTGNGLGGAIVAMVLGLIAVVLGGLARARRREVA